MNTIENNKLLAVFLGGKYKNQTNIPLNDNEIWLPKFGVCNLGNNGKVLKFNSDWNWLMEVVEKIETMGGAVCIGNGNCVMIIFYLTDVMGESYSETRELTGETKIEATYNACVEFIKWYNEQNK
jgi:hypothetical protein